jgi:hypothetical protein
MIATIFYVHYAASQRDAMLDALKESKRANDISENALEHIKETADEERIRAERTTVATEGISSAHSPSPSLLPLPPLRQRTLRKIPEDAIADASIRHVRKLLVDHRVPPSRPCPRYSQAKGSTEEPDVLLSKDSGRIANGNRK